MSKGKIFALFFLLVSSAFPQEYPSPAGAVNDFAGLLTVSQRNELEQDLRAFFDRTGAAIVVATFESLEGVPIEDYAVGLFEKWKIGQKGRDFGLLILVAKQERKIRFEVGYGLEPVIPDGRAGEIIRVQMTPRFREGDYAGGIFAAVAEVERILEKYFATGEIEKPTSGGPPSWVPILLLFFVGGIVLVFIFSAIRKAGLPGYMRGSHWQKGRHGIPWWMGGGSSSGGGGGGGFGGGFGGFGGGSSGGGGATGGW